jgi:glycerol-3-phosphate dehydrogenase
MSTFKSEVLIIGGGVLGTAIARELSKYKVDVSLVEQEVDVGFGLSKANAALVCQGGDPLDFSRVCRRSKLVWDSIPMMEPLCHELEVPFKRVGELRIARNADEMAKIREMKTLTDSFPIHSLELVDGETLHCMEPNITREAIGALYDPMISIIDPVRLTIALAENARQNGVNILTGTEVLDISPGVDQFEAQTNRGSIKSKFIVNAAGKFVEKVARMAKADSFSLTPVKGQVWILDKKVGTLVSHVVDGPPYGISYVEPTVHGNLLCGLPLKPEKLGGNSTTREAIQLVLEYAHSLVPVISEKDIITSFAGYIMYRESELGGQECTVEVAKNVPKFINVSVGTPGVSACPAIAKEVVGLLNQEGLRLEENHSFNPYRKAITHFSELPDEEKRALIAKDPRYGHMVCRCEMITEGEVVEAIRRGATTIDGVKFRTRAGMGRCQGGFCSPRVIGILARELGIPEEEVTKKGSKSRHILYKSKQLLGVVS